MRSPTRHPLVLVTVSEPRPGADPAFVARKNELYAAAVRRHGADVVVVDPSCELVERKALFQSMAGLVLTGGPDLNPALYEEPNDGCELLDLERDALELEAWVAAERRSVPVLGICRGLQAMNVFAGGSLVQDVAGHAGPSYGQRPALTHELRLEPDSRLAAILSGAVRDGAGAAGTDRAAGTDGAAALVVNSYHHQAVSRERLARAFRASAWAEGPGGPLVEGLEGTAARWLVGVQCHPERTDSTPEAFDRLFGAFVEAARSG